MGPPCACFVELEQIISLQLRNKLLSEEHQNLPAYFLKRKVRNTVFLISEAANGIVEQPEKRFNSFHIPFWNCSVELRAATIEGKRAFKAKYIAAKPAGSNYVEGKLKLPLFCGRFSILSLLCSVLVYNCFILS